MSVWYIWCGWSNFLEQFALPKILVISQLQPELTHSASLCHRFESFTDKSWKTNQQARRMPCISRLRRLLDSIGNVSITLGCSCLRSGKRFFAQSQFWSLVGSVICLKLALNSSPTKLKLWRLPGKVRPSRLWLNRFPNVKFCRLAGHDTCFRLWLNSWQKAKYSRLLG